MLVRPGSNSTTRRDYLGPERRSSPIAACDLSACALPNNQRRVGAGSHKRRLAWQLDAGRRYSGGDDARSSRTRYRALYRDIRRGAFACQWDTVLPTTYQFEVHRDSIRLRVEVDRASVPVKVEERREQREWTIWRNRRCYPGWNWDGADIPAHKPAYRSIRVDAGGRYWVELYTEAAEDLTITTAAAAGADEPPVLRWREPSRHDIFTPEGDLLGTVTLPDQLRILALGDGFVWGTRQEPDGIPRLFLYRIPALD
jgi:hypothetical protein